MRTHFCYSGSMKSREQIYEFINSYKIGVLATVNPGGLPNGALIGFGLTKDLELIIGTDNSTRKYKNMQANPHVAFTVGGATLETVQLEGTARELGPDEMAVVREIYWVKHPYVEKYAKNPSQRYLLITPTWIRYTNIGVDPWEVAVLELP